MADGVVYNGERLGIKGYRAMLQADVDAIPDLRFTPEILLARRQCRSLPGCFVRMQSPARVPGFRADRYAGHRFRSTSSIRFDEWRISSEVWSVIDKEGIREQISPQCSG